MRKYYTIALSLKIFVCMIFAFTACTEVEVVPQPDERASSSSIDSEFARKGKSQITSFVYNGRTYAFVYDASGRISTINVSEGETLAYQYVVQYDGKQLVAANLVENGQVMSSNTNFEFNRKGNIVGYDYVSYFFPEYPEGIVQHYSIAYDKKGNLVNLAGTSITYDNHRNVIQWGGTTFTYNKELNPLALIPDLWVILVEEPFFQEYVLSRNESTSKTLSNGTVVTYSNQYNSKGQLITKTGFINGALAEQFVFTY